jgi:hypothetical protein
MLTLRQWRAAVADDDDNDDGFLLLLLAPSLSFSSVALYTASRRAYIGSRVDETAVL